MVRKTRDGKGNKGLFAALIVDREQYRAFGILPENQNQVIENGDLTNLGLLGMTRSFGHFQSGQLHVNKGVVTFASVNKY